MNKKEFIESMKDFAETYGDVTVQSVSRTNHSYTGMFIPNDGGPTPVVNLDNLYEEYCNGTSIDECYEAIDHIFKASVPRIQIEDVTDWDNVKKRLCIHLYGSVSDHTVYKKMEDIYMVPYIQLSPEGTMGVRVTDELLDIWHVDIDEVFARAKINQEILRPVEIKHILDLLNLPLNKEDVPMYIVTTYNHSHGAVAILYEGVAEKLRNMIGGDFYILPSSVDEVIVIPKNSSSSVSQLAEMVRHINRTEVREEDQLTDSVYIYDFKAQQLKKAD